MTDTGHSALWQTRAQHVTCSHGLIVRGLGTRFLPTARDFASLTDVELYSESNSSIKGPRDGVVQTSDDRRTVGPALTASEDVWRE